jgi:hypothetical protein
MIRFQNKCHLTNRRVKEANRHTSIRYRPHTERANRSLIISFLSYEKSCNWCLPKVTITVAYKYAATVYDNSDFTLVEVVTNIDTSLVFIDIP